MLNILSMMNLPNLLIVDDKLENLIFLESIIKKTNVKLIKALSGYEALEKTKGIELALAIIDVQMPGMDGIEATQEILQILGNAGLCVSIIGLSAFDQEQIKDKAIRAGMKEYVTKPITFKKMNQNFSKYI